MQTSRRDFIKNAAIVTASTVAVGGVVLAATSGDTQEMGNGVNVGESKKKEVLYAKTVAWEEFYNKAK